MPRNGHSQDSPWIVARVLKLGGENGNGTLEDLGLLSLRVQPERDCLVGYIAPNSASASLNKMAPGVAAPRATPQEALLGPLVWRLPLLNARAIAPHDLPAKAQPHRDEIDRIAEAGERWEAFVLQLDIAVAGSTELPLLTQTHTVPSNPDGRWLVGCRSAGDLQALTFSLQAGGCIMRGLEDRYAVEELVGRGSSALVFLAEDLLDCSPVAVKIVKKTTPEKDRALLREVVILKWAQHDGLLQFKGLFEFDDPKSGRQAWAIVTEFIGGGELFDEVQVHGPLREERTQDVAGQLFSALTFLHTRGIVHRDIKAENVILVDASDRVKLADFGLATLEWDAPSMLIRCGSPGYIAPEVLRGHHYGCKVDCFGVGVLLYILLTGRAPFRGRSAEEMLVRNMQCKVNFRPVEGSSAGAQELVQALLVPTAAERLSSEHCLAHSWVGFEGPDAKPMLAVRRRTRRMFSKSLRYSDLFEHEAALIFERESPGLEAHAAPEEELAPSPSPSLGLSPGPSPGPGLSPSPSPSRSPGDGATRSEPPSSGGNGGLRGSSVTLDCLSGTQSSTYPADDVCREQVSMTRKTHSPKQTLVSSTALPPRTQQSRVLPPTRHPPPLPGGIRTPTSCSVGDPASPTLSPASSWSRLKRVSEGDAEKRHGSPVRSRTLAGSLRYAVKPGEMGRKDPELYQGGPGGISGSGEPKHFQNTMRCSSAPLVRPTVDQPRSSSKARTCVPSIGFLRTSEPVWADVQRTLSTHRREGTLPPRLNGSAFSADAVCKTAFISREAADDGLRSKSRISEFLSTDPQDDDEAAQMGLHTYNFFSPGSDDE